MDSQRIRWSDGVFSRLLLSRSPTNTVGTSPGKQRSIRKRPTGCNHHSLSLQRYNEITHTVTYLFVNLTLFLLNDSRDSSHTTRQSLHRCFWCKCAFVWCGNRLRRLSLPSCFRNNVCRVGGRLVVFSRWFPRRWSGRILMIWGILVNAIQRSIRRIQDESIDLRVRDIK